MSVDSNAETRSAASFANERWAIFLCYRQVDGTDAAEIVYQSLHGESFPYTPAGCLSPPTVDVYFDRAAPAVDDWTVVHGRQLKAARSFVVVCSPGACVRLAGDDWVHREIDWWLANREAPPILIDPVGDGRWTPPQILARWPSAQRLQVAPAEWPTDASAAETASARLRDRILAGIQADDIGLLNDLRRRIAEEVATGRSLRRQRRWLGVLATSLLFAAVFLLAFGLTVRQQREEAQRLRANSLASSLVTAARDELSASGDDELVALLAAEAAHTDSSSLVSASQVALTFLLRPMAHILDARTGPVALSPVTAHLAAGCIDDSAVCVWDLKNRGAPPVRFKTDAHRLLGIRFSTEGNAMTACTLRGALFVWNLRNGVNVAIPFECPDYLQLSVVDDGRKVAVAGRDRYVTVWDVQNRSHQQFENPQGASVVGVSFERDQESVTVLDLDGNHYLWSPGRNAQLVERLNQPGLALASDGETAILRSGSSIIACERDNGKYTNCSRPIFQSLPDVIDVGAISPKGHNVIVGGSGPTVALSTYNGYVGGFKIPVPTPIDRFETNLAVSEVAPGEQWPWFAAATRELRVWPPTDFTPLLDHALGGLAQPPVQEPTGLVSYDWINSAEFSRATSLLAVTRTGPSVFVYDVHHLGDPIELRAPGDDSKLKDANGNSLFPGRSPLAWSEDGRRIGGYRADGQLAIWEVRQGSQPIRTFDLGERPLYKALSPTTVAYQGGDNNIHLKSWDGSGAPRQLRSLEAVSALAWSEDGRTLLAGSERGVVKAWFGGDWDHPVTFEGNQDRIFDVAVSPEQDEVAAATSQAVVVWKRSSYSTPFTRLLSQEHPIGIRYSPSGDVLAAATGQTVVSWNLRHPALGPFVWIENGTVNDAHTFVRFAPGGGFLITSGWASNLISFEQVMRTVCELAWRNLSVAEWRSYVAKDLPYRCTCSNLPPGAGAPTSVCQ